MLVKQSKKNFLDLRRGLKFFIVAEGVILVGTYFLWAVCNRSQRTRKFFNETPPLGLILKFYYKTGRMMNNTSVEDFDRITWSAQAKLEDQESEICVDKLLVMNNKIDILCETLDSGDGQPQDITNESRKLINQTQMYIDNNRAIIPPYILKKVSDSLKKLEKQINGPDKSKLTFKFNSKPSQFLSLKQAIKKDETEEITKGARKSDCSKEATFGYQDRNGEKLSLELNEIDSKDVSLVNLMGCEVEIRGLANTVYVRGLRNSTVTIYLARRAITVRNCSDCKFKFICQQLRIDSTTECMFNVFTSARSMLESSTGLRFAELNLDKLATGGEISKNQLSDLVEKAGFNKVQNNWDCIDDFDWLSSDRASKNFELCDSV